MEQNSAQSLLESLPEGVFAVDEHFNLVFINSAAIFLLGIKQKNPSFFDLVGAFKRHYPIEEVIAQVFKSKKPHKISEVKIDEKYFQISTFPVFASVPTAAVFIRDKTEDTTALQKQEEFMAMVVHDLRSPLTVVKGMAELLVAEYANLSKEKQKELLVQIKNSSAELLKIVNSLLDDTKADLMKFDVKKAPGNLNRMLRSEVGNYKGLAEEKGLEFKLDLDNEVPAIEFDETKLSQVMNNLLSNALKFTNSGSITVRSEALEDTIKVCVADTGEGISDSQKTKLFKKFSQLENSKRVSANGTGLGLSIAKGIVEAHGGEIWIEDNKPHGAIFAFTLPL